MKDLIEMWGYQGKTVVVDGAASGMGLATTKFLLDLGAEVYALDIKECPAPVKKYIKTDLGNKESIDATVASIPGEVRALFCCAGLPGAPFPDADVVKVNFLGHRHLIESLIPRMKPGEGAIAIISSMAGMMWRFHGLYYQGLLDTKTFEEGVAWIEANSVKIKTIPGGSYSFSKECICAYGKAKAAELAPRGIRLNVLNPTTTATPMLEYFQRNVGEILNRYKVTRWATPEEMAYPLVFLNSSMASFISGQELTVDEGLSAIMELAPVTQS
jgi:NAD(P)-dependent dehydrogenase (short-subunit alcohol dehydrogenase family)